jgi:hypothetical protein
MRGAAEQSQPTFWASPDLVDAGYRVLPVQGKEPTVEGGWYAATDDKSQIAAWIEEGRQHHDIGVPTGVFGGLVAIDADTPEGFAKMLERYGEPTYLTKRGGHWLFRHPRNGKVVSSRVGPGLDRKGDGGFVVVPPSKGRAWTNGIPSLDSLPVLPEEFWSKKKEPTPGERKIKESVKEAAAEVIARYVRAIEPNAKDGGRHDHLLHLCGVLLERDVSLVDAEDILVAAWTKAGGDLAERADSEIPNALRTTQAAIDEGRATGVPSMEKITPGLYDELVRVMGWVVEVTFGGKRRQTAEEEARERRERSDDAWEKCADLARESDILGRFVREQHEAGVVGEELVMKLLYLAITSRVLSRPISTVTKGASSSGKTYTTEQTLKAFPESAYHDFSGMSERALIYTDKDFRHKFIYIPEAAGVNNDFLDYVLRTLLSEHRIKYITVEQRGGKNVPREIIKEGPTGLLMTTTRTKLHPENETRLLSLTVNDSREQTKAVMRSIALRDGRPEKDYTAWHALQVWIEGRDNRVTVPYGEVLAGMIEPVDMRIRRDFELLLNAIHAHVLLHQATRERDEEGRIVATLADYGAVRELVNDVMSTAVQARVGDNLRRVVAAVVEMLNNDEKPSVRKLEKILNMSKSVVQRWLKVALSEGYLLPDGEDSRGRVLGYLKGADIPADIDLLPTVKELAVRLSRLSQEGRREAAGEEAKLSQEDMGQRGTATGDTAGGSGAEANDAQDRGEHSAETPPTEDPCGTAGTAGQGENEADADAQGTAGGTAGGTVDDEETEGIL